MKFWKEDILRNAILATVLLLGCLFFGFYVIMQEQLQSLIDDEVDQYIASVENTVMSVSAFTQDYESILNEKLYHISKNVRFELQGAQLNEINTEQLMRIQKEYGLSGLAIFKPTKAGDHFEITVSTNKKEIGENTKDWGYWNTAFSELFNSGNVTIDKGQAFGKEFWVGPRTLSYYQKGYYRFAYLLSDDRAYLINAFVSDDTIEKYLYSGHIESALDRLKNGVAYIDSIGIIQPKLWQSYLDNKTSGNNDPYLIYGKFKVSLLEDLGVTPDQVPLGKKWIGDIEGQDKSVVLYRVDDHNILVLLLNRTLLQSTSRHLMLLFVVLSLVTIAIIATAVPVLIAKYSNLTQLEHQRIELVERFNETLKGIPDLLYICERGDLREFELIYNEGHHLSAEQIILSHSERRKIDWIYGCEYAERVQSGLEAAFDGKRNTVEIPYGAHYYAHTFVPLVSSDEGHFAIEQVMVSAVDVTDRVRRESEVQRMTLIDYLTGMPNRKAVKERFDVDAVSGNSGYLMYLDLNRFKPINDAFGHNVGDLVLSEVASRLMAFETKYCLIGRVGGDEFVAWVTNTTELELLALMNNIKVSIAEPIKTDSIHWLTVSIGYSVFPEDGTSFESLVAVADVNMYQEKRK